MWSNKAFTPIWSKRAASTPAWPAFSLDWTRRERQVQQVPRFLAPHLVSLRWRLTTFPDLGKDQADALETVASVEDRAVSDVIRAAIAEHIENRRQDPGFQAGLKERIARAHKLLGD